MSYGLTAIDYRIEQSKPVIYLFARDDCQNKKVFKVKGFKPYYYYKDLFGEYPVRSLDGSFVTKKYTKLPSDVAVKREQHQVTYESDILFPIRFMVDRGIRYGLSIEDGEVVPADFTESVILPLFLDIEVEVKDVNVFPDPRKAEAMLLAVTIWCPIDGNIAMWQFEIHNEEEEAEFLEYFISLVEGFDPDLITSYNVFFDMATILGRMKFHNININRLSPLGYASISRKYDDVRIAGRNVFDYYGAYKKYKHKTLASYKLEDISYDECDIPHSDYPMEKMNRQHSSDITDYNLLDVYRMQALEFKLAIIPFYDNLRQTVGCTFKETFEASKYVDIMLLRYSKGKFILPRRRGGQPRLDYVGAVVLPPEKGLHENVIMLDFTKHYPIILISYNISPETLRLTEPDEPHYTLSIGLKHTDEMGEKYTTWQDVYYLKEPAGLLPSVARDLIALRNGVRDEMVQYPRDSQEYKLLWFRQDALKVVLDAMYGVFAYPNFRLFIPQLSASMTGQGQKLILRTIDFVEGKGYKALYGDTDSVYFAVGDSPIKKGEKLRDAVNQFWMQEKDKYGLYAAPNVKLEYVFESLLLARKKRYSAMVIYDNGEKARSLKIVGFAARRSDSALISQALQNIVFKQIHEEQKPTSTIIQTIKKFAAEVPTKALKEICIPLPLKTPIDQMKNRARVKSIIYANKYLDQHIDTGTHSLEIYIKTNRLKGEAKKEYGFKDKPVLPWHLPSKFSFSTWSPKEQHYVQKEYIANRVAFGKVPGEEWRQYMDMAAMTERVIWNKVDIILNALGVSVEDRVEMYGSKRPIKKEAED